MDNLGFHVELDLNKFLESIAVLNAKIEEIENKFNSMPPPVPPVPPAALGSFNDLSRKATELKNKMNDLNPNTPQWKAFNTELEGVQSELDGIGNKGSKVKGLLSELLPIASVGAGIAMVKGLTSSIIQVRSEFEKYSAVLTTSLGSQDAANAAMSDLVNFASSTPFQLSELTGAYVKLTNYGLKPSMEQMRQMGDLASSVGKGFDQLAEAAADAVTGEFERLKEFGIKSAKEGDKVTFTFKEQKTVVENNAKAIQAYLLSLGDMSGVKGSMDAISKTMGGQISNLQDNVDKMFNQMGESTGGVISASISGISTLVEHWKEVVKIIGLLVATYGSYKAAVMVTNAVQNSGAIANNIKNFFTLTKAVQGATVAQQGLNTAQAANPIGLIVAGIMAIVVAYQMFHKSAKTAADLQQEFNDLQSQTQDNESTAKMISRYDELSQMQVKTNEEQAEYNRLIEDLSKKYPDAIGKINEHGKILGLNVEKLKSYNEQQKAALKLVAEDQLKDTDKSIQKLEEKLKKAQEKTAETYTTTTYDQFGVAHELTRTRSGSQRADAAADVLKYSEELAKLNDVKRNLQVQLGQPIDVPVNVEVVPSDNGKTKEAVKASVKEQIDQIQQEIRTKEKDLKQMRLSTSVATPEDIEKQEKGLASLKKTLETLTGVKEKSKDDSKKIKDKELKDLEEAQQKEMNLLQKSLFDKNAKQDEINIATQKKEADFLRQKIALLKKQGEDTTKIESDLFNKQLAIVDAQNKIRLEKEKKLQEGIEDFLKKNAEDIAKTESVDQSHDNEVQRAMDNMKRSQELILDYSSDEVKKKIELKDKLTEINKLYKAGALTAEQYAKLSKQAVDNSGLETTSDKFVKGMRNVVDVVDAVVSLTKSLNEDLGDTAETLMNVAGNAASFVENIITENWTGVLVSGFGLLTSINEAIKEPEVIDKTQERIEALQKQNDILQQQYELLLAIGEISPFEFANTELERIKTEMASLFAEIQQHEIYFQNNNQKGFVYSIKLQDMTNDELKAFLADPNAWAESRGLNPEEWKLITDAGFIPLWENVNKLLQLEKDLNDTLVDKLGFSRNDVAESIAQGIIDGMKAGEDGIGDFTDTFGEFLKKTLEKQLIDSLLNASWIQDYVNAMNEAINNDGIISTDEMTAMEKIWLEGIKKGQIKWESYSKALESLGLSIDSAKEETNTLKGEFKGMSEETAGALEGRIVNMQLATVEMKDATLSVSMNIVELKGIALQQLESMRAIQFNTSYNSNLVRLNDLVNGQEQMSQTLIDIKNKMPDSGFNVG